MLRQLYPLCAQTASLEEIYRPDAASSQGEPGLWRANMVTSLNGSVEIDGVSKGLSGRADRKAFHVIRAFADAVLIGSGNAISEGYTSIPDQNPELTKLRRSRKAPLLVVTTRHPEALSTSALVTSPDQVIIATLESKESDALQLATSFQVTPKLLYCGVQDFDYRKLREELGQLGLGHVVCEGGPSILGRLVGAGVLDEICLSVSPLLAASHHGGFLGQDDDFAPTRLHLASIIEDDGTLLYRYRIAAKMAPQHGSHQK